MATHDYVIANGTGAAVRSDLNGALAAIVSNNSSATQPATMYAYQWWADTTTGLLKIRNSANSAWVTLFELDGTLVASDISLGAGTVGAPSLFFTGDSNTGLFSPGADTLALVTAGTNRVHVTSGGLVGIGTTDARQKLTFGTLASSSTATPDCIDLGATYTSTSASTNLKIKLYVDSSGNTYGFTTTGSSELEYYAGNSAAPGKHVFLTGGTERMRINSAGQVTIGCDATTTLYNQASITGVVIERAGAIQLARSSDTLLLINRISNDGDLVNFYQNGTAEGSISVSGSTVSYNGAHLSRWSQLPGGTERIEILRGTVLSNIDEMCGWGEEANEQLNRMKVSDVEGDKNVSGVFQCWDDDDDIYIDDFYCAMTGDFIIRIAKGVTVARGDLLMSAGDGTAKPQDDDIIRSKTVAKVTSTHVACTYEDGSYCVPCVLMAC